MTTKLRSVMWLLIAVAIAGCARAGGEPFQGTSTVVVPLTSDDAVAQTISPATSTMAGIDLNVATFATSPDPDGQLHVTLRDATRGTELARDSLPGDTLGDGAWVSADFGGVAVDEVVLVEVTWDGATPLALWANRPAGDASADGVVNDPYPGGQLLLHGAPADGDLAFRVRGEGGVGALVGQVVEIVRSAGNRLLEQPAFAAVWALALAGAAVLAGWGLRHRPPRDPT